jgi:diguanylate cyclase (GGDEF)-like protein
MSTTHPPRTTSPSARQGPATHSPPDTLQPNEATQDPRVTVLGSADPSDASTAPPATASGPVGRWFQFLRQQLASGVGRRLFAMFVLASLAPVALMAMLSFSQVSSVLVKEADRTLLRSARHYGKEIIDRMRWIESNLADAAGSPNPSQRLALRMGRELTSVAVLDRAGQPLAQAGEPMVLSGFDPLSIDARRSDRRTLLFISSYRGEPRPVLVHPLSAGEGGYIAAGISPTILWDSHEQEPGHPAFCVAVTDGTKLFCSRPVPEKMLLRLAVEAPRGDQTLSFDLESGPVRAGAVALGAHQRFAGPDLVVVATLGESDVLRPAQTFRAMFVPIAALSVLLVLLLSVDQVRRILMPLHRLLAGMKRVTDRDFGTPVPVVGKDEFGQIAQSFNKMTTQLGLHFRTLSAFSEIDRTILTTVDMRQVADIALNCIQEISGGVKVVSLGLLEADTPDRTQVYLRASGGMTQREELPKALDLSGADASLRKWSKSIRLPADFRTMLHQHGAKYLYLLPIARADKVWGVVALGHDQHTGLSGEQAQALAGVIDRLAVAMSSVARDKQLHDQAHFDGLTGLPNRHYLMDMLTQQLSRARRDCHALGVLYIDLDRFKRTNDTLGHAAGDVLLKHAAERIRRAIRDIDIVARLGGDEFTVVLSKLKDATDAGRVARALINALNEPFEIDGHVMYAGASIGIAMYPNDGESSAELLKKADTALYLAKDRGRGRYAFFEERMNVDASARATIDRELREALKRREFRLHYQPQIDLATGEVCAVEALLRWQHPQRGLLAPGAFIDQAEESGLIEAIGTWVLREAVQQHRRWVNDGVVLPRISVNVSALQLRNPSFAATVEGALTSATTSPHYLELEVTESLFLDAGPDAVATLERLRERGVEIAVDDFGTGYSSFAYVKQLPANVLKLDRSFIVDVVDSQEAAIIAGSIIEMAHALGKTVVAEGVETAHQTQFLRRLSCARAQGFVFSGALPPEQIPAFVKGREREPAAGFRSTGLHLVHSQPSTPAA